MKTHNLKTAVFLICVFVPSYLFADEYKASLAKMPIYAVSKTEGILVELVKEIESRIDCRKSNQYRCLSLCKVDG